MVLYDVILVGFPEGPKVGSSEAEALSTVFGIPKDAAERMVAHVPTVVKSGVPEDVCRKYFNAFAYMGAKCHFAVTAENPTLEDGVGTPRLASTDIIAVATVEPEHRFQVPFDRNDVGSRTDSAPVEAVAATPDYAIPTADTSESIPSQLLREMLFERAASADTGTAADDAQDQKSEPPATPEEKSADSEEKESPAASEERAAAPSEEAFDLEYPVELTPLEITGWQMRPLDLPDLKRSDPEEPSESDAPPKTSIVDADPAIDGSGKPLIRSVTAPKFESDSWGAASDSAPVVLLQRAANTGELMPGAAVNPRETTAVPEPAATQGFEEGAGSHSVAAIRAAWQAGQDIPLRPTAEREPPSLGEWDPWVDSELTDADFPSGVAVTESLGVSGVDEDEGTRLDVPVTSRLMAQLDAERRLQELLGDAAGLRGDDDDGSGEAVPVDSSAPLFGAPLGAANTSESGAVPRTEPKPDEPEPKPKEVPMAAMNFRRRKKKPTPE